MFAHQVIEDQKKYFPQEVVDIIHREGKLSLKNPNPRGAQCFHIGEYSSVLRVCKIAKDGPVPFEENMGCLRLPFRQVWIDCFNLPDPDFDYSTIDRERFAFCDKNGVLVHETSKNLWTIMSYFHYQKYDRWLQVPGVMFLTIGDEKVEIKIGWLDLYGDIPSEADRVGIVAESCGDSLAMVMALLKLLNCKNIGTEKIIAPERLNKKRRKTGKQELFDYHVLNVVAPSKKRGYCEVSSGPMSHNRVHLCRGHFKEYTKEHPLFGHSTGTYWWQPHVRGQNRQGVIMKDYKVTA